MYRKNIEFGRSLVEMLGVLAIIGILSIAGIAGFKNAMDKNKANTIISEAQKRATLVVPQIQLQNSTNPTLTEFNNNNLGYATFDTKVYTKADNLPEGQFGIKVAGISKEICQNILNTLGDNTVIHRLSTIDAPATPLTNCGETNTFLMVYNNDMTTNHLAGEYTFDTCPENFYQCATTNSCVASENDCPSICALNEDLSSGCVCPAHRDTTDGKCGDCVPSETYRTWVQPVLTSNGIMGGSDFACSASTERGTGNNWKAWRVFDGSNSDSAKDCWHSLDNDIPGFLSWYTSKPIKIKDITLINRPGRTVDAPASVENFEIQYSDDNSKWFTVLSGKNPIGLLLSSNFVVNASTAHNYWRIYITSTYNTDYYTYAIGEININTDELVSVTNYELDTSTGQCVEVSG